MPKDFSKGVEVTLKETDMLRKTLFRRFPVFFTVVVAFGVGATFYGLERGFETIPFFYDYPWRTLVVGLLVLLITGKLYAKLG
jgi:hypothetical protein